MLPRNSSSSQPDVHSMIPKTDISSEQAIISNRLPRHSIHSDDAKDKTPPEAEDYMNKGRPHTNIPISPLNDINETHIHKHDASKSIFSSPHEIILENSLPSDRRSVHFVGQDPGMPEASANTNKISWDESDKTNRDRKGQSLISKLKALTSTASPSTHKYQNSITGLADECFSNSPRSATNDRITIISQALRREENDADIDADADADAEETADEDAILTTVRPKKKMRFKKQIDTDSHGSLTAPTTPGIQCKEDANLTTGSSRNILFGRRATEGNIDPRLHFSEGEGEDLLNNHSNWRKGYWIKSNRGHSISVGQDPQQVDGGPSSWRPSNLRRAFTGLGGGFSEGEASTPKRQFLGADRATTFGAQRWRMIRHGLKMLGQKKEEHRVDYLKSAELMAELRAGAPAALMLASMVQRDEHGNKRIPVLLEQVKPKVTDSKPSMEEPSESERHLVFRIELEYGSGLNRMKWVIHRSLRDFANLHIRYKLQGSSDKYIQLRSDIDSRPKQPRFPKSAFPYFRAVRGLGDSDEDETENVRVDDTLGEATQSENDRMKKKKRRAQLSSSRKKSCSSALDASSATHGIQQMRVYNERQRRRLENYLQEMIRWLIFRADSNRLCRFLELSALGVRLAAEGSYHGKEGYLIIQSANRLNMRRLLSSNYVISRHTPKWFLVRHSYIVCVDSPENIHIHDVFLVDSKFEILAKRRKLTNLKVSSVGGHTDNPTSHPKHHSLKFLNSERKVKLLAKNERILRQFEDSINFMLSNTVWLKPNRFGSFAPVRDGIFAQWLVDGRDYMWNVSRAINMAKDVIYIHDWWLSPQLYMRRPPAISQKWRLDRLLQRKAREGVKIFIIIYRNVEAAIPIDSEFTKISMLDLHPNIFVQRSPNQFKKNQFFYAHHEKICIIDHTVAFVGGIDLCFGRWDTPQHSVVDDKPTGFEQSDLPKDADHCQLWPGKDYSNPRVQDFYHLNEPYAEMYDRSKTPRMPWHDISMQIVGQPARDLTRHFVQRWNYVLRGRKPTRPTPFLLPPPDYEPNDLKDLGLSGTCEVQILRSASDWSLGLTETEHSIMTAYCKMIEESEHFVYIENQFFISSCDTMNVKIVNKIGDAIVERAIRAHQNNESWRCVVLIPLMPGFQNTVDEPDGTSVRLIMQCQFRSICRGEGSIFGRLRSKGIYPEDYVQFFSLRAWGRIGPQKALVTEQLYIHAKAIIVDDRVALIGSANINERSMLGMRDSECAAIVRDTDMLWSTMDGEPYLVGRFAHTLRMRLMREHIGLDVDGIMEEERLEAQTNPIPEETPLVSKEDCTSKPQIQPKNSGDETTTKQESQSDFSAKGKNINISSRESTNAVQENINSNSQKTNLVRPEIACESDITSLADQAKLEQSLNASRRLNKGKKLENGDSVNNPARISPLPDVLPQNMGQSEPTQLPPLPVDDSENSAIPLPFFSPNQPKGGIPSSLTADIEPAIVNKECMRDPIDDSFYEEVWRRIAENNTKIFRRVFRCNPDSKVQAWSDYRQFVAYAARLAKEQSCETKTAETEVHYPQGKSSPPDAPLGGTGLSSAQQGLRKLSDKNEPSGQTQCYSEGNGDGFSEKENHENVSQSGLQCSNNHVHGNDEKEAVSGLGKLLSTSTAEEPFNPENTTGEQTPNLDKVSQPVDRKGTQTSTASQEKNTNNSTNVNRNRRRNTMGNRKTISTNFDLLSLADCEELLALIQGNLVNFPYDWLVKEELNSNWLYQVDQVAPLQI